MSSKAQIAASARYDKTHAEAVTLKLNKKNDADILQQLAVVGNRQGYIKELIRRDLRQKGGVLSTQNIKILIQKNPQFLSILLFLIVDLIFIVEKRLIL